MWLIYDLIIHLYGDAISLAALFSPKARKWVAGRRGIFREIESAASPEDEVRRIVSWQSSVGNQQSAISSNRPTATGQRPPAIWFHCASLGEFEQGRPVIEAFRKEHPGWKIVLTFFSPSGYEIRKNYEGADHVFYLPLDTPKNVRRFIRLVKPSIAVFVKYEFWFRYLDELHRQMIPVYIISAIFRPGQHFFRWYGSWARKQLVKVNRYFVQDEDSAALLQSKGIDQVTVSGDTRFDRVAGIAANAREFRLIGKFAGGKPVFLAGSTWSADEELILKLIREQGDKMKFIIAPHEVHPARVEALTNKVVSCQSSVYSHQLLAGSEREPRSTVSRFSELDESKAESTQVLVIDGIGFLSHLYQYATIAYIGGGFGVGIHNILEAAAFGKPVIFGPNYRKFREAVELIEGGGAFSIDNSQQLNHRTIELLDNKELLARSSEFCSAYVQRKKGATAIILSSIKY